MKLTRRGKVVFTLVALLAILLLVAGGGALYLASVGVLGASDPGREITVQIPEGATVSEIGRLLEQRGVIESGLGFRIANYLDGGDAGIQAGRYTLTTGMSARAALAALGDGPEVKFVTVTFPEGSWLTDFAARVDEDTDIDGAEFLEALKSGKVISSLLPEGSANFEGLLFPSTYQIVEDDTPRSVAQRLATEMERKVAEVDMSKVEALNITPYDMLIVASMVQAEARVDSDRPKIARVIYNRLHEGMALGIDATVIYATGEHKTSLTESDLAIDSPYNTRLVTGLPPTPIGAPGSASIEAAADPAPGDWLYYVVADCEGHHAFSVGYDDFLADKARYQQLDC